MGRIIERTNNSGQTIYGIRWTDEHGKDRKRYSRVWTKAAAQAELTATERKLAVGVVTTKAMTVEQLFNEWLDNHVRVNCSPAHLEESRIQYRLRIGPMIGHRRIDTINRRIVRQMVAEMQRVMRERDPGNEHAGHRTINKTLTVVKGMLTYAVHIEQLPSNPAHGVPALPESPTRQIDAWPLEVIQAVADAARDLGTPEAGERGTAWAGERDYAIIMLAALTGLRQSEVLGLRWDRIDGDWLHVTHKLCRRSFTLREPKSRRGERRVPLLERAKEVLEDWRDLGIHEQIVFPNQGATDFVRAPLFDRRVWDKARDAVAIIEVDGRTYDARKMTFHELRHTFVSRCLAAGRDIWEVANWAGDDPEMIKKVYGHYIPGSLGNTDRLNHIFAAG
ncbi:MAG: site-specific integrase [Thermoleophilia bacterium]|nr:site-specific integrase [Thermoleophilia bacterium]